MIAFSSFLAFMCSKPKLFENIIDNFEQKGPYKNVSKNSIWDTGLQRCNLKSSFLLKISKPPLKILNLESHPEIEWLKIQS